MKKINGVIEKLKEFHYTRPDRDGKLVYTYNSCPICGGLNGTATCDLIDDETETFEFTQDKNTCPNCILMRFRYPEVAAYVTQAIENVHFMYGPTPETPPQVVDPELITEVPQ